MRIILASGSPRRRDILAGMGYKFDVILPNIAEITGKKRPSAVVQDIALKKAFAVASLYPDALVIGGDTVVYCKGRIIGKPKNAKDALRILHLENGSWQSVYSGLALICKNQKKCALGFDITKCKARFLDEETLKFLALKHLDKAGAYAMQDKDDTFIERVIGSYDNVVGMPTELLKKMMKEFGK
ncbi:MAG: Maf family protein [Elusimicrobiota bacterium]|jgi:septum formation protein|nr:Maf family protein [Elusimicrobiota bacterium]